MESGRGMVERTGVGARIISGIEEIAGLALNVGGGEV